jgi:excisionase family DNA binding protein
MTRCREKVTALAAEPVAEDATPQVDLGGLADRHVGGVDRELVLERLADVVADRVVKKLAGGVARYTTVAGAANYSGLSQDSIRSLISRRRLTAYRPVPGRVLVDRRQLDALILSSTGTPRRGRGIRSSDGAGRGGC